MNKVFEDFIFNFYAWHLDKNLYHVHRPRINWPIEEETTEIWFNAFDVNTNPGDRRTDIVIDYCVNSLHILLYISLYISVPTFNLFQIGSSVNLFLFQSGSLSLLHSFICCFCTYFPISECATPKFLPALHEAPEHDIFSLIQH